MAGTTPMKALTLLVLGNIVTFAGASGFDGYITFNNDLTSTSEIDGSCTAVSQPEGIDDADGKK